MFSPKNADVFRSYSDRLSPLSPVTMMKMVRFLEAERARRGRASIIVTGERGRGGVKNEHERAMFYKKTKNYLVEIMVFALNFKIVFREKLSGFNYAASYRI